MAGNSLIFKQDSHYEEHFYSLLKPWTHFVPVRRDLSNLVDQVKWAMAHDARSRHIVANMQSFVDAYLLPKEGELGVRHFLTVGDDTAAAVMCQSNVLKTAQPAMQPQNSCFDSALLMIDWM
ncbi:unnamed protein product [Soboliphyme baturini]|uniref:CAP10 domain-containing protein n=1 Tax=Soboliphyme baturini TaxID=241478 RepID=A0A183IAW9_9BILA|nr:unnamed protein product [Soboliphyme baturini]